MDAGRKEDATQISIATLAFTKSNVPSLYTTVLGLQVRSAMIKCSDLVFYSLHFAFGLNVLFFCLLGSSSTD